jgi:hypothetical protein
LRNLANKSKGEFVMRNVRYFFLLLLVLLLLAPQAGWSAKEATGPDKEAAAAAEEKAGAGEAEGGRGEGFETCPPGEECPATFGPIIADSAIPIARGKFAIQPTWGLFFVTDVFSPNWRRESAGGNYTSFNQLVKLSYGLWENLEINVQMNTYEHRWARNVNEPGPRGETSADFGSTGNTLLGFKYQFVQESPTVPTVTGYFGTVFPTGHYRNLNPSRLGTDEIGQGGYQFLVGCNLQKYLEPFIVYGNVWYRVGTSYSADGQDAAGNPAQVRIHPRNGVIFNLAAEYPITKKWVALLELISSWDTGRQIVGTKSNQDPGAFLTLSPGIEFMATEKLSFAMGVAVDVIGKNNNANVAPLFSIVYAF